MAREIRLSGIGEHFEDKVIRTVKKATLLWEERVKKATPVDTGNLKGSWQNDIQPFVGEVFTDVEYAEPVAYGTSLPPSWGGQFRTRQQTIKGYPELIGKQLEGFIEDEFRRA
tara:strand:- start:290 stop:628 length:339 start_codon:yes stop_codon:yes gene_type:complete